MSVLIVTGAGRGIGAATARLGAARGHAVVVNYASNGEAAETTVAAIKQAGGKALTHRADVSDPDQVVGLFDAAEAAFGPVGALVNNAAILGPYGRLDQDAPADIQRVLAINALGPLLCCREAIRRMSPRHGGNGGAIVNVSSMAAALGAANEFIPYAATKGALESMTVGLGREVSKESIRVNAVRPGLILTDMQRERTDIDIDARSAGLPIGRAGEPEEVAETILWLLSDAAAYIAGVIVPVAGGLPGR